MGVERHVELVCPSGILKRAKACHWQSNRPVPRDLSVPIRPFEGRQGQRPMGTLYRGAVEPRDSWTLPLALRCGRARHYRVRSVS